MNDNREKVIEYIVGKTIKIETIEEKLIQIDEQSTITLKCDEYTCYVTESKPNGETNLAFHKKVVH
jgi:hypothetical protein